jgi:hypothetical protein
VELIPTVLAIAIIAAITHIALDRYFPEVSQPRQMVTLDVVKLANAERALASKLWNKNAIDLTSISKRTRQVIQQYAGGRLVIIKQATVGSHLPDITDDVLRGLGLPTNVPTQLPSDYVLNPSPTMAGPAPSSRSLLTIPAADPSKRLVP